MSTYGALTTIDICRWSSAFLQFNLFGDAQRVINLDAEISYRTLKFGVAKQDLDGPQVPRLFVNQGGFGSAH